MTNPAVVDSDRTAQTRESILRSSQSQLARLHNSGMAVLLLLLVATVFVVPAIMPEGASWQLVTDVLATLILASGVVAVLDHRRFAIVLGIVSAVAIAARAVEWIAPAVLLPALRESFMLLALLVLVFAVGMNVFEARRRLGERIVGAVVLYLLIGLTWAVVYIHIDSVAPSAFSESSRSHDGLADWVYFSFVTLTTVGFGDITPVTRAARALTILEALVGQLYPAVIIARLVSLSTEPQ